MGALLTAAIIGAAVGATAMGVTSSVKSGKEAKGAGEEALRTQEQLTAELRGRQQGAESAEAASEANAAARRRQRQLAAQAFGRRDTILTGPLGIQDEGQAGRKTLLGT